MLGELIIATLNYFEQSKDSIQMSGYNRNASEALLLAESAANMLYGRFVFGGDLNGDGTNDNRQGFNETDLSNLPLHYMYYRGAETTDGQEDGADNIIARSKPSILQLIANGEARSATATSMTTDSAHKIPHNAASLMITDLYSTIDNKTVKPILFTIDDSENGGHKLKIEPGTSTWTGITGNKKAAAWLELTKDPTKAGTIQIYVQAVGQIGKSKNYIQRFVGIFPNSLGLIAAATESN